MTGLYVQLDTNWPDHPKIIAAGLDGAGLHAIALCLAKRLETDGILYRAHLLRLGGSPELIDRLVELGLFDAVDDNRIAVHDWLDRNPSRGDIGAMRGRSSLEGKRGNHLRWKHAGDFASCPICHATNAQVVVRDIAPDSGLWSPPDRVAVADRDRDRDRANALRDPTVAPTAEAPARDLQRNLTGIAEARAATRSRPAPQEAPE
jgi:hypothetical protein